jgi:hypothetical protein
MTQQMTEAVASVRGNGHDHGRLLQSGRFVAKTIMVGLVLASIASATAASEGRHLTPQEREAVGRSLASQLRDPGSAVFKFTKTVNGRVCGLVNARNGYGGFTGFLPFHVNVRRESKTSIYVGSGSFGSIEPFRNQAIENVCAEWGMIIYSAR